MRARMKGDKNVPEIFLDFTGSQFSSDEIVKQIATRLQENNSIHTLVIERAQLYEKGTQALRQAVLGHKSLRKLCLYEPTIYSYPVNMSDVSESDYFFPKDLDAAVEHFSAMLRDARLNSIEVTELSFVDNTARHFQHTDMADSENMSDILFEEKQPFYIAEITDSLKHNPHLRHLIFSMDAVDVNDLVDDIENDIRRRHASEELNQVLEGTHAAIETHWFPEMFKVFAWNLWREDFSKRMTRRKMK